MATSPDLAFRVRVLTELLERLPDLTEPGTGTNTLADGATGERLSLMPHDAHCAFMRTMKAPLGRPGPAQRACDCSRRCVLELERLLYELQFRSWTVWRHVRMRYLQCEHVTRDAIYRRGRWQNIAANEQVLCVPGGWALTLADARSRHNDKPLVARVKVASWDPSVQAGFVRLGVEWMAENWAPGFEPYLPVVKVAA